MPTSPLPISNTEPGSGVGEMLAPGSAPPNGSVSPPGAPKSVGGPEVGPNGSGVDPDVGPDGAGGIPGDGTNGTSGLGTVGGTGAGTPPGPGGPVGIVGAVGGGGAGGVMGGAGGGSAVGATGEGREGSTVGGGGIGGVAGVGATAGGSGGVDVGATEDAVTLTGTRSGSDRRRLPTGGTAPLEDIVLIPAMTVPGLPRSDRRAPAPPAARQPSFPSGSSSAVLGNGNSRDGDPSVGDANSSIGVCGSGPVVIAGDPVPPDRKVEAAGVASDPTVPMACSTGAGTLDELPWLSCW